MARKIYMTSFKGGTGVTTCCVGLGFALAQAGERTLIADGDVLCGGGLLAGGCANMQVYTLADYERSACRAKQTLITHPKRENLSFMASVGLKDRSVAGKALEEVEGLFDWILSDKLAPEKCDGAIIVCEPYAAAIKSADVCKSRLSDSGIKEIGLIVNKLNGGQILSGEVMTAQEIAALLRLPLKAVIPEDLLLPLGKCKKRTVKAFALAADCITGKREAVCNVLTSYFGPGGYFKRKVREMI